MQFQETILCSAGPSATGGPGCVTLHDLQAGTSLASFKQTNAERHCTAVVETKDGQGGFILAAQPDKSILNVYSFQRDQLVLKVVLPEKLTCIAVDGRGDYCAGGTAQGRIYLWEVASGILFNAWDAHYRKVTVLRFTRDGAACISGSEDSAVSVWSMSRLLANELQNELPEPYCALSDHTLPISDIAVGTGPFPACRVLTASTDHSVKLWDLSTKSQLTTFIFPHPIQCLAFDITERAFFAASSEGSVHQVVLFRRREAQSRRIEALGGGGASEPIRFDTTGETSSNAKRTIQIGHPVTSLAISLTSSTLLVGTSVGAIHLYDIASHQLLRSIAANKGFAITHLQTMLRPPDLIGHVSLSLSAGAGVLAVKDAMPTRPVAPFQRIRDAKARGAHEVLMTLPGAGAYTDPTFYDADELARDHAFYVQPAQDTREGVTPLAPQSRLADLEAEVQRLREQLGKAKAINDTMWESVVQRMIADGKDQQRPGRSDADMDEIAS